MRRANRTALLVGMVAALAFLGILIWFGTTAYSLYRKPDHSTDMSDCSQLGVSFFEDVRTARRASAYQALSSAYRSRLTQSQFEEFLDEYPLLNSHAFVNQIEVFGMADSADQPLNGVRIRYRLLPARMPPDDDSNNETNADPKANRRKLDLSLHFVEENGNWVVDQITFP